MNLIDQYVNSILAHVESGKPEREDLRKEIGSHLEDSKREYEEKGLSEPEAIKAAIADFGDAEEVGDSLQKTIAPFSKPLLLSLGVLLLLYSAAIYMYGIARLGEHYPVWLAVSAVIGLLVIVAGYYPSIIARMKVGAAIMLALSVPVSSFGLLVTDTGIAAVRYSALAAWFAIFAGSVTVCVMIILRNPDRIFSTKKEKKTRLFLHILNILIGIIILGYSSILLFGLLWFGFAMPMGLYPFLFTGGWIALYSLQMRFLKKKKKNLVFAAAIIQAVLLILVLVRWGMIFFI